MFSFTLASTGAAEAVWAQAQAVRDLRRAADSLDTAQAWVVGLTADTEWNSAGVRALRETLSDFERRTSAAVDGVRAREAEVAGIEAR